MNSEEKFIFDLENYIVIKNVLKLEKVTELNLIADRILPSLGEKAKYGYLANGYLHAAKPSS